MITPGKILIIRPDRLGDLILSLPVAETLKRNLPQSQIHYFIAPYTAAIAPMIDYVDSWLIDRDDHGRKLSIGKLAGRIRLGGYDCLIELKPSWRTALAGFFSGIKLRIGTSRRLYSILYSRRVSIRRRSSGLHQVDLELRHLDALGINDRVTNPRIMVTERGLENSKLLLGKTDRPYVVIHPGSGGSAPNWPLEHYRELAVMIRKKLEIEVVITGDRPVSIGFDGCIDLGGKTDLESLAAVLIGAAAFISGSTGPLHLADALGALCLSFFANRSDIGPARWGPRRSLDNVFTAPDVCDCGNIKKCRCLERIAPDAAFEKLKDILKSKSAAGVKKQ